MPNGIFINFLAKKKLLKLLKKKQILTNLIELIFRESISIIHNNIRCFTEISNWNWYRLLLVVKELVPLNRDKQRLEELLLMNDELTKVFFDEFHY